MKIDILGQGILIIALMLLFYLQQGLMWTKLTLFVLWIWQFASAIHLLHTYQYIQKQNYVQTALILCISLPIWLHLVGNYAYLPVTGVILWYFIQSVRDTIVVYRRPRSFWDLID